MNGVLWLASAMVVFGSVGFFLTLPKASKPRPQPAPPPPDEGGDLARPSARLRPRGNELGGATVTTSAGQSLRLTGILGVGANSYVYEGVAADGTPPRAVKILTEGEWNAEMQGRFEREVRIGTTLTHPNLVKVVDWGTMPQVGRPFIVMEKLEGRLLQVALEEQQGRPMPPRQVVACMVELLDCIGLVHQHHIIHRDLKPENVMVLNNGHLKVLDFGIARQPADGAGPALTRAGTAMGTPRYMSPEHLNAKTMTPQSDLYSLGVMAYEMLAGRAPFLEQQTLHQTLMQIVKGTYPDILSLNPSIPAALADWVRRMMAKNPTDRYATASEALRALRATGV